MVWAFVPGALAFLLFLAPATVRGELAAGAEAGEVQAKEYINSEPVKLSELKGRLILLELFKTT